MKCEDCVYFFKQEIKKYKNTYCSLRDHMVDLEYKEEVRKCGNSPSSVILDDNQPVCSQFKNKE
jgi:hypothetical protein